MLVQWHRPVTMFGFPALKTIQSKYISGASGLLFIFHYVKTWNLSTWFLLRIAGCLTQLCESADQFVPGRARCVFPAVTHRVKRIVECKLSCSIGGDRNTLNMVQECVGCNQNNFTRVCLWNTETSVIFEVRVLNLSLKAPKHVEARGNTDRSHSPWTRIQQTSTFKLSLQTRWLTAWWRSTHRAMAVIITPRDWLHVIGVIAEGVWVCTDSLSAFDNSLGAWEEISSVASHVLPHAHSDQIQTTER